MSRVLITGASGLLGSNLVLDAAGGHEVSAIAHRRRVEWPGVRSFQADLAEAGAARELMNLVRPEWVIHCAAATDIDACETEPTQAFRVNRDMAGKVAEAAHAVGARLAHISTDAVFDGERGGYAEDDLPAPINVYARSKLEGEEAVRAACPEALIIRTNIYGWNAVEKKSLAEWFLANLESGKGCRGFADVLVNPLLVNDLGDLLFRMLEAGLRGLYHVAGGDCVSKYEFGVQVARAFDLDPGRIERASVEAGGLRAPRGRRLCLAGRKIEADLGVHLPGVRDGLARFKALREQGRPDKLRQLASTGAMAREGAEG